MLLCLSKYLAKTMLFFQVPIAKPYNVAGTALESLYSCALNYIFIYLFNDIMSWALLVHPFHR